ncbi:MAG: ribosomal protein [Bacteroidota bacterium]|jgi:large subunit ribosomal protein L29
MSDTEITEKIGTEISSLTKMKMNHAVSPLENPLKLRHSRREIARLKTELTKRTRA